MAKDNFDKNLKRLEVIVAELEEGDVALETSMKLFEEGIMLSRECSQKLDGAEKKVTILMRDESGDLKTEPFDPDNA